MVIEETPGVVVEEIVEEVTEEVETIMGKMSEVATENAAKAADALLPAQEFFGLHRPAAPFKVPRPVLGSHASGDTGNASEEQRSQRCQ